MVGVFTNNKTQQLIFVFENEPEGREQKAYKVREYSFNNEMKYEQLPVIVGAFETSYDSEGGRKYCVIINTSVVMNTSFHYCTDILEN